MLRRTAIAIGAVLVAGPVVAQVSVRTTGFTRIEQPATISASRDLVFAVAGATFATSPVASASRGRPAQAASSASPVAGALQAASSTFGSLVPAPARASFVVVGDSGQSISVVVPETIALVGDGGAETAMLTTDSTVSDGPQFLDGSFGSGGTLSFDVGGQVTLDSSAAVSGTYNGVLAVVAQYN